MLKNSYEYKLKMIKSPFGKKTSIYSFKKVLFGKNQSLTKQSIEIYASTILYVPNENVVHFLAFKSRNLCIKF